MLLIDTILKPYSTFSEAVNFSKDTVVKNNTVLIRPSILQNHLLKPVNDDTIIHFTKYEYGTASLLFIAFALFVWLYVSNNKFMQQLFRSYYLTSFSQSFRDENSIVNRASVLLSIMFFLLITLFIAKIIEFNNPLTQLNFNFLIILSGILIVAYTFKIISIRFLGFVLNNKKEASDYIATIVLFWNALAIFLLPVLASLLFLKQLNPKVFITIGLVGVGVFLIIRLMKAILIGLNSGRISKLYLFLYLCTLEILPFLLIYKWILIFST